jgi:hypothetical protein
MPGANSETAAGAAGAAVVVVVVVVVVAGAVCAIAGVTRAPAIPKALRMVAQEVGLAVIFNLSLPSEVTAKPFTLARIDLHALCHWRVVCVVIRQQKVKNAWHSLTAPVRTTVFLKRYRNGGTKIAHGPGAAMGELEPGALNGRLTEVICEA